MLTVKDRYLYEDGKPFFWLGDTAWLMLEKLSEDEIRHYFRSRSLLGYNVVQIVLLYSLPDKSGIQNGMPVYDRNTQAPEYFDFAEKVVSLAESYGMYTALLPAWGSYVTQGFLNESNVSEYAEFLGKRFSKHKNIIWIMGGDVRGDEKFNVFDAFGKALKAQDPDHLMSFHPFGRTLSARWFNSCSWLDFNMFQSGHRRYDQKMLQVWDDETAIWYGEDNWKYVDENNSFTPVKPCLDAEPSYEGIIQGLHDFSQPYWEEKDVRRYAYWSVFRGACGFTYGHNSIIQFYDPEKGSGAYGVRESWKTALHAPGSTQLQFLKSLMESVDFTEGRVCDDYLLTPQKERHYHISLFGGENFLFAYTFTGEAFKLSLKAYSGKKMEAFWMNPQSGVLTYEGTYEKKEEALFCPVKRYEDSNDWVLVLKEVN
ncbi:MAG: glycoside hydrolase family 140 protein [Sphaerochaetaceae bacterium]|nr:glycoside hydrolase family 140 protein [Sphaerochaetaceae bacterium]